MIVKLKRCVRCGVSKNVDQCFSPHAKTKDRRQSYCKDCVSTYLRSRYECNRQEVLKYNKAWREKNKDRLKERAFMSLLQRRGMTLEQYETLVKLAGNCCQICGREERLLNRLTGIPRRLIIFQSQGGTVYLICSGCCRSGRAKRTIGWD